MEPTFSPYQPSFLPPFPSPFLRHVRMKWLSIYAKGFRILDEDLVMSMKCVEIQIEPSIEPIVSIVYI